MPEKKTLHVVEELSHPKGKSHDVSMSRASYKVTHDNGK